MTNINNIFPFHGFTFLTKNTKSFKNFNECHVKTLATKSKTSSTLPVIIFSQHFYWYNQKQPPRGVFKKRCSENMQQSYRRTHMSKSDFNNVAVQLYWNRISAWVSYCKFTAYFLSTFSWKHLLMAASVLKLHFGKGVLP